MKWAYGVTTVPSRRKTLLPRTLKSLSEAGFDDPHLFIDGEEDPIPWRGEFNLDATAHHPKLGTVGNWVTALWVLHLLDPHADRYAIFQDDVSFCLGLREYLEATPWVERTYLNLYSSEYNEIIIAKTSPGTWSSSFILNSGGVDDGRPIGSVTDKWNCGKGALAIVLDGEGVLKMLSAKSVARKPRDREAGHWKLDGMIVNAMNRAGFKELIHSPSLCQHAGQSSSAMGNGPRPLARSFPGEGFDARTWLKK